METLYQYLARNKLLENGNPSQIKQAKKQYRKEYLKTKRKEYRKTRIRKEILFLNAEMKTISNKAKHHQIPIGRFIKQATLAYIHQKYILPDPSQLHKLEIGIRRIGNNINQIAYLCHRKKSVLLNNIKSLQQEVYALEHEIRERLSNPPRDGH